MKYLITKKCDGSIVDFGYFDAGSSWGEFIEDGLQRAEIMAITIDRTNGTRIRYER